MPRGQRGGSAKRSRQHRHVLPEPHFGNAGTQLGVRGPCPQRHDSQQPQQTHVPPWMKDKHNVVRPRVGILLGLGKEGPLPPATTRADAGGHARDGASCLPSASLPGARGPLSLRDAVRSLHGAAHRVAHLPTSPALPGTRFPHSVTRPSPLPFGAPRTRTLSFSPVPPEEAGTGPGTDRRSGPPEAPTLPQACCVAWGRCRASLSLGFLGCEMLPGILAPPSSGGWGRNMNASGGRYEGLVTGWGRDRPEVP